MDYFDILLAKKLNGGGGGDITIEDLTITANGEYRAPSGKAYGKVTANVPAPSNALFKQTLSDLPSPIATFTGADAPLDSLKASIVGVQSGSGDPSPDNVRPLTGWTECEVTRTGKNLINPNSWEQGVLSTSDGKTVNPSSYWVYSKDYIKTIPNGNITLSLNVNNRSLIYIYDKDKNFTRTAQVAVGDRTKNVTLSNNEVYLRFALNIAGVQEAITPSTASNYEPQAEVGETATTYEPYNGNTYTIAFKDSSDNPINVYRGTIDITTGVATITEVVVDMEDIPWSWMSSDNRFRVTSSQLDSIGLPAKKNGVVNVNCSMYPKYTAGMTDDYIGQSNTSQNLFLYASTYAGDVSALITATTGQQLAYEIATPIIMQFDPIALRSNGVTNISVNCGEVTELKYFSDTP